MKFSLVAYRLCYITLDSTYIRKFVRPSQGYAIFLSVVSLLLVGHRALNWPVSKRIRSSPFSHGMERRQTH